MTNENWQAAMAELEAENERLRSERDHYKNGLEHIYFWSEGWEKEYAALRLSED